VSNLAITNCGADEEKSGERFGLFNMQHYSAEKYNFSTKYLDI
jgi:hypothetical protein